MGAGVFAIALNSFTGLIYLAVVVKPVEINLPSQAGFSKGIMAMKAASKVRVQDAPGLLPWRVETTEPNLMIHIQFF